MKTANEVFRFLANYMRKSSSPASAWYAGIAADPKDRLFVDHNVDESEGGWAYAFCQASVDARSVEKALLGLGCKGGPSGGDHTTKGCYVYLITPTTYEDR